MERSFTCETVLLAGQSGNRGIVRIHKFIRIYSLAVTVWTNGRDGFTCKTAFAFIMAFPVCQARYPGRFRQVF